MLAIVWTPASSALALEPGLPQRVHAVGGAIRIPVLRGEPAGLARDVGFGFAVGSHWFYRPGLGLCVTGDYDRFGSPIDPEDQLSRFGFSVAQVAAHPLGRLLPWAAAGGGLVVGLYRRPGTTITDTMPLLRASAGLALEVHRRATVGVSGGYDFVFAGDSVAAGGSGRRVTVFDDIVYAAVGLEYFF
jgi:hypothetical protein